jgi:allantoinase
MDQEFYPYSPIVERPPLEWPGGAGVAFYLALNVEHFHLDRPALSINAATSSLVPDPLNYGWRDYGARVGIWRMIDALDQLPITPSVAVNSEVCGHYPQIIKAGTERDWCWVAHAQTNSLLHSAIEVDEERKRLDQMITDLKAAGLRPRGWLGSALSETFQTARLLSELGFQYVLDWCNDDQPYPLAVEGMISVPYSIELNDLTAFVEHRVSGADFVQMVRDQLEQLLHDSRSSGRVMALAVHPFIVGQPFRHRYLVEALEYICRRDGVWLTTSDAIADHYMQARPDGDPRFDR